MACTRNTAGTRNAWCQMVNPRPRGGNVSKSCVLKCDVQSWRWFIQKFECIDYQTSGYFLYGVSTHVLPVWVSSRLSSFFPPPKYFSGRDKIKYTFYSKYKWVCLWCLVIGKCLIQGVFLLHTQCPEIGSGSTTSESDWVRGVLYVLRNVGKATVTSE